jgi:hypothetical protein
LIPGVEPWVSSEDIDKGARWNAELTRQLDAARFGVICLVPENLGKDWLIFEAGAIARSFEAARVAPLLLGVEMKDVPEPLAQFQCTVFEKGDMRRLVRSINRVMGEPVERQPLDEAFEQRWPDLEGRVQGIDAALRAAPVRDPEPRIEEFTLERAPTLPEEQAKILRMLALNPGLYPSALLIGNAIGQNQTRAMYHLDRLRERHLVNHRLNSTRPPAYYLTEEGRAYVVENNLDQR